MMLDQYDQDLLLDYLEGELDAEQRAQIDTQLAANPKLARLLEAIAQDRDALRKLPKAEAPSELAQDLTQSLERHMLLDDAVPNTGPIPLARGNDPLDKPVGGLRWGRVLGLTGLAASVALAAGIVVLTMGPDPLIRTADILSESGGDTDPAAASPAAATLPLETGIESRLESLQSPTPTNRQAPGASEALASAAGEAPGVADERLDRISRDQIASLDAPRGADEPDADRAARFTKNPLDLVDPTPAVALAITVAPRQQLVLYTDDPERTREALFLYCIDNGIAIVRPEPDAIEPPALPAPATQSGQALDPNALLMNQQQLGEVLLRLNDASTADTDEPDLRDGVLNTAAEVAAFEPQTRPQPNALRLADAETDADDIEASPQRIRPKSIVLHAPSDLGSVFANHKNQSNLFFTPQRIATVVPADNDLAPIAFAEASQLTHARQRDASNSVANIGEAEDGGGETFDHKAEQSPASVEIPSDLNASKSVAEQAQANNTTRSNWLAPHLPLAVTTPIWTMNTPADESAFELVPIVIQKTPANEVNRVRLRQQAALNPKASEPDEQAEPATANASDLEPLESSDEAAQDETIDDDAP